MITPLTILYDAIVGELRRRKFKVVDYNGLKNPRHDTVSTEDLPEWDLRPTGMSVVLGSSSCATDVSQAFQLVNNTGDKRLGVCLFPENWRMIGAMYHFQYGGLDALTFKERRFVQSVSVQNMVSGITDPSGSRPRLAGWASMWSITVIMSFPSGDFDA